MNRRALQLWCLFVIAFAIATGTFASSARADGPSDERDGKPIVPLGLEDVGVSEHMLGQVPVDAIFQDHTGKAVRMGDLFDHKRPVLLTLAYHSCPTVCSMVLSQTVESMKQVGWTVGDQYQAVTLSFDPRETMERTAAKRTSLLNLYGRPGAEKGWTFLRGDDTNIHRVTDAVGFNFHYVANEQQYAHPTVIMLLTPDGKVARYLYGLEYAPNDLKLGLLEASEGRSINTVEKVLLYCYHYDPNGGKYVLVATRLMQLGGVVTAVTLFGFIFTMWLRERKRALATANS